MRNNKLFKVQQRGRPIQKAVWTNAARTKSQKLRIFIRQYNFYRTSSIFKHQQVSSNINIRMSGNIKLYFSKLMELLFICY